MMGGGIEYLGSNIDLTDILRNRAKPHAKIFAKGERYNQLIKLLKEQSESFYKDVDTNQIYYLEENKGYTTVTQLNLTN